MALEIQELKNGKKVLMCNTTDWAFGPVFREHENAQEFLDTLENDARTYEDNELGDLYGKWSELQDKKREKNYVRIKADEMIALSMLHYKETVPNYYNLPVHFFDRLISEVSVSNINFFLSLVNENSLLSSELKEIKEEIKEILKEVENGR